MQLAYVTTTKSLIVAHLDSGEVIPPAPDAPVLEGPGTYYITVDGSTEAYRALVKMDPTLESVADPSETPEGIAKAVEAKAKDDAEKAAKARTETDAKAGKPAHAASGHASKKKAED